MHMRREKNKQSLPSRPSYDPHPIQHRATPHEPAEVHYGDCADIQNKGQLHRLHSQDKREPRVQSSTSKL